MPLIEELQRRLHAYEKEAEEIRPWLQRLEELIRSVKVLLSEEERQGRIPLIQVPTNSTAHSDSYSYIFARNW